MFKVCLVLLLAVTVSCISIKSRLSEDEEKTWVSPWDLRKLFKGIGKEAANAAICAEIEAVFAEYAALSDDPDKDQLCQAEFG